MVEAQRFRKAREEGCLKTAGDFRFRVPVAEVNSRCPPQWLGDVRLGSKNAKVAL